MLGKQITLDEAKLEAVKLGGRRGCEALKEKLKDPDNLKEYKEKCREAYHNSPNRDKMIKNAKENQSKAVESARTPEAIKKKKKIFKEIKHQQGEKNSHYGKMWITDVTKDGSYRISKDDMIQEGYRKGGVCK